MITKTFRRMTYRFTEHSIRVIPRSVHSILCQLSVILSILIELLLTHHYTSIISHQIAVLNVLINVFSCIGSRWLAELHWYINRFKLEHRKSYQQIKYFIGIGHSKIMMRVLASIECL